MKNRPKVSPAEWQVLKVIWAGAPILAREVIAKLADQEKWHPKTVRTLLARLVKKGAVGYKKKGRAYIYRPLVKEADGVAAESQTFLNRVFAGNVVQLVTHFVQSRKLSESEAQELRQLLAGK